MLKLVLLVLIPSCYAFMHTPSFIEIQKTLINSFDCNFYNNVKTIDVTTKDFILNVDVNKEKTNIYINLKDNGNFSTEVKRIGLTNSCPSHYSTMPIKCNINTCYNLEFFSLKIESSLENLEKMTNLINKLDNVNEMDADIIRMHHNMIYTIDLGHNIITNY